MQNILSPAAQHIEELLLQNLIEPFPIDIRWPEKVAFLRDHLCNTELAHVSFQIGRNLTEAYHNGNAWVPVIQDHTGGCPAFKAIRDVGLDYDTIPAVFLVTEMTRKLFLVWIHPAYRQTTLMHAMIELMREELGEDFDSDFVAG